MTSIGSPERAVAFLVPRWPPEPGGLARAAARLSRGLAAVRAIEVIVPDPRLERGVVRVAPGLVRFGAGSLAENQRMWEAILLRRDHYALVHAVYPSETGFPAVRAAKQLQIPCLLAVRGNDLDRDGDRPRLREALATADAVVGVSQALTAKARALGATGHTLCIPNGVSAARFSPQLSLPGLKTTLGLPPGPLLAFVGEARPKKGLATMLEAIPLVRQVYPGAHLWLIGGARADGRALVDATDGLVVETPGVDADDLPALLALADLGWHPSHADGLPNALLESLACGLPTLGARTGGIPDVLDAGILSELLIPAHEASALAALTLELLANPARKAALAAAGRARVLAAFTPEVEVARYLALYDSLLSNSP